MRSFWPVFVRRLSPLVVLAATCVPSGTALATPATVKIAATQPTWTLGVFAAYVGPTDYDYVAPGVPAEYLGREAGLIKAGLIGSPWDDEGLFAFKPYVTIGTLAANPLTYDVVNQYGTNPVWMTIEIDTGVVGEQHRDDNVTFQMVPAPYGKAAYVTVDAGAATNWLQWNDSSGDTTGNSSRTLASIASEYAGKNVIRTYLRLGMGSSYNEDANGTQAWVDKTSIAGVTYDFVVRGSGYTKKDWSSNPGWHGFKNP